MDSYFEVSTSTGLSWPQVQTADLVPALCGRHAKEKSSPWMCTGNAQWIVSQAGLARRCSDFMHLGG